MRNKGNSQQYPSLYEGRRPKSIEDTEKTDRKGIALGQKGRWDQHGEQGNCSPRPLPSRTALILLEERPANDSLPCQTKLEQHRERPGCLKWQGSAKPTETVGAGWGQLRVGPCGVLIQTVPGLAGEMGCVRRQAFPCMEGVAGLSRRISSKRKRPSGALWGILLQQQLQSPLHLDAGRSRGGVGGIEPKS